MKDFGSSGDNQMAASMLFEMRSKVELSNTIITDIVAKHLSKSTKLEETDVRMQLSEPFTPDDDFMFGSRPIVEPEPNQSISKESSLSFDEDVNAGSMVEDEATSELSVRFHPRGSSSPSIPQVISIDQLMESALEVAAGQVVVVSTSPLPYDTMTNRFETFGTGTRQKISKWLATENSQVNGLYRNSLEESCALEKEIICLEGTSQGIISVCGVELRRRFSMFSSSALMLLKCGNSPRGHLASTHPKALPSKRNSRPLIDVLTFRRWGLYPTSFPGSVGVYG
ncbi:hypothetical protein YC2023_049582 [Brassica napus]